MLEQTRPKYKLAGLALLIVCVRPGLEMMDASNPDDISDAGKSFDIQELVVPDLGLWLYFWGTHQTNTDTKRRTLRPQSVVTPLMRDPSRPGWVATTMVPATWWPHMTHTGTTHDPHRDEHLGMGGPFDHREQLDFIIPQSTYGAWLKAFPNKEDQLLKTGTVLSTPSWESDVVDVASYYIQWLISRHHRAPSSHCSSTITSN